MKHQGLDPALATLLKRAPSVELDYHFVMDCLKKYKRPAMKLDHLIKIGALTRIKRGLYVLGQQVAKKPYCLELLANKIYGPSYVSLEWALQYHGLVPERVEEITCVTLKRSKKFTTPLGRFSYHQLTGPSYPIGVDLLEFSEYQQALIATKEKALADMVRIRRGRISSRKMMEEILFDDLRIEAEDLLSFDLELLQRVHDAKPHSAVRYLIEVIAREQSL